jgi:phosphate transport system substrate-binding protein
VSKGRLLGAVVATFAFLGQAVSCELTIVGTGDGIELLQAVGAGFNPGPAGCTIVVPPSIGSGGAVAAVGADRSILGRVARPLTAPELAQGLQSIPLVSIPSAIFVHPSAGIGALSSAQLADVFAGKVENWKEVGGADIRIRVVRREESDSTLAVLRASMAGWKSLELTPRSKLAITTQDAIETVRTVPGSVAFGPFSRSLEPATTVLAIDGRRPNETGYPSAVVLSLIFKEGRLTDPARAFLDYARSPQASKILADEGGVPFATRPDGRS